MNTTFITVLDLLGKSAGILLLAFAVQSLWCRASAAHRCIVWMTTFGLLALLPVSIVIKPLWTVNLSKPKPSTVVHSMPVTFESEPILASPPVMHEPPVQRRQWPELSTEQWLALVWLSGVVLVLGKRGVGSLQVLRLRRQSKLLTDQRIQCMTDMLTVEAGIQRSIVLRSARCVSVPLTWGVFKPVLLLPETAVDWSDARLASALRHELGHIRHFDAASRMFMTLVCAFQWPNPLVWLAAMAWRTAQEQASDDLVIKAGSSSEDYAMQLLDAARAVQTFGLGNVPVMAMARPSTLETRLTAIMDTARDRRPISRKGTLAGLGLAALLFSLASFVRLGAEEKGGALNLAATASGEPLVGIEVKFIEAPEEAVREIFKRHPEGVFSGSETSEELRTLLKDESARTTAYPRMVTMNNREVVIRSVVYYDLKDKPTVSKEHPELLVRKGTEFLMLPTIKGDAVKLDMKLYSGDYDPTQTPPLQSNCTLRKGDTWAQILDSPKGKGRKTILWVTSAILEPQSQVSVSSPGTALGTTTIGIQAHLIEAPKGTAEKLASMGSTPGGDASVRQIMAVHLPAYLDKLRGTAGVDVLSAPKVITLPGQKATIRTGREVLFEAKGKKTPFFLGSTLEFLPKLLEHQIDLSFEIFYSSQIGEHGGQPILQSRRVAGKELASQGGEVVFFTWLPDGKDKELIAFFAPSVSASKDEEASGKRQQSNGAVKPVPVPTTKTMAEKIIIPKAQFQHASLQECIEYLRLQSKEHDPEKQGVNIIIRNPAAPGTAEISLDLKDIPLSELLKYVTELSGMVAIYEPFAIVVTHPPHRGAEILTRSFRVTKDWSDKVKDPQAWLTNQGMQFPEGASAKFSPGQSELIVKAAEPELEKAEALIEKAGMHQEAEEAPLSAAAKAAQAIVLPKVVFQNATIEEVVDYLRTKGVNIILKKSAEDESPKVTLSLANVPLLEALRYSAELAQLQLTADDNAIVLQSWSFTPASKESKASVAEVPKALVHARTIVFPSLEFRDATVTEVADFLRIKSQQLDPSKAGVNLVLKPDAAVASAKITLSLKNVSLSDTLKYVAALAGLELKADDSALVLQKGK